jgi:hypothetical protein
MKESPQCLLLVCVYVCVCVRVCDLYEGSRIKFAIILQIMVVTENAHNIIIIPLPLLFILILLLNTMQHHRRCSRSHQLFLNYQTFHVVAVACI